jgi:cyclophilin family peptidyl-prolyl cis-trans isomerase
MMSNARYAPPEVTPLDCGVRRLTALFSLLTFLLALAHGVSAATVRVGTTSYDSLQAAYAEAVTGATLQAQNATSSELLYLNREIDITLKGGYDTLFSVNTGGGLTTINGPVIITAGSLVLENISITGKNVQLSAPDVVGQVEANAGKLIRASALTVGTVALQTSASVSAGTVISQDPSTGTPLEPGATINLLVSSGPPPPVVILTTSMGIITITLFPDKAPVTVNNFLTYVQDGFYDGLIFHRVLAKFMIQGGGMTYDPVKILIPKATRSAIVNEANNGLSNKRGTIAMARTSVVDSATSQFFINTVDNTFLDYAGTTSALFGYAVFGVVTGGMDVVDAISAVNVVNYINSVTKQVVYEAVPLVPVTIITARRAE